MKYKYQALLFFFTSSLIISSLSAQVVAPANEQETTNPVKKLNQFYQFSLTDINSDTTYFQPLDTSLTTFYNYNKLFNQFHTNLGNIGSPQYALLFNDSMTFGLDFRFDHYDALRYGQSNLKFYELSQPYASVTYLNGAQREEGIKVLFSQNVRAGWNLSAQYRKISSEGFYVRQRNAINNFNFTNAFRAKNNRYHLYLYGIYNDTYMEENGGIVEDSLFLNSPNPISRKGFTPNFTAADNNSRQQEYFVKQIVNFGKWHTTYYQSHPDSLPTDSILSKRIIPKLSIEHQFLYQHQEHVYRDNGADSINYRFKNIPQGQIIFDKSLLNKFDNQLAVIYRPFNDSTSILGRLNLKAGASFQYGDYLKPDLTQSFYHNIQSTFNIFTSRQIGHNYALSLKYNLDGYNTNDYLAIYRSDHKIGKAFRLNIELSSASITPALPFQQFNSYTISWNNQFKQKTQQKFALQLGSKKHQFAVGVKGSQIENYTYFDIQGLPKQYNSGIAILQPYISKTFELANFYLMTRFSYQEIDQRGIINLPEWLSYSSIYYQNTLFKKEMLFRIGSELYYTPEYNGNDYHPTTRQFFIQHQQQMGDYLWLEPFLMVKVDRFFFFARLANALEGVNGNNYLSAPAYPMQDRAFKFSIKWDLIN